MRSRALPFAVAILVLLTASPLSAEPARLLVLLVVDGLSQERLDAWRPWYREGLARLMNEGRQLTETRYAHLNTETGPGHASLGTGAPPRMSGIVANTWTELLPEGRLDSVYCTDEPGSDPKRPVPGPGQLRVPTLGDRLVEARPGARVVSLSGKDRGAIFLAGKRREHAVFWYDIEDGTFRSSPSYDSGSGHAKAVAGIVARFTESPRGQTWTRFGRAWKRLPAPEGVDAATLPQPARDITLHQNPIIGLGFDHVYDRDADGYFSGVWHSPGVDDLLADLAIDVISDETLALGRGKETDLLCLSFSAKDLVSHSYGDESEESLEAMRRLDASLGRVLAALEKTIGKERLLLGFSADHGFSPIPEVRKKKGEHAGRLVTSRKTVFPWVERLNRRLSQILCLPAGSRPVAASDGFNLTYQPKPLKSAAGPCGDAARDVGRAEIDAALPRALDELYAEEVDDVLLVSRQEAWGPLGVFAFARNDLYAGRTGDALVVPRPGVLVHWDASRGSGHGSHLDESARVPLIFWGAGVRPGTSVEPVTPYDLAPTLGARAGVRLPDSVGRALALE